MAGGVAACWKRKGFLIDGGIHFVLRPNPKNSLYKLYSAVGIDNPDLYETMQDFGRYVDEASGTSIVIHKDLGLLADYVRKNSPEDAKFFDNIVECARGISKFDTYGVGMEYPPELSTFRTKMGMMWSMRKVFKYYGKRYDMPMSTYTSAVKAPWLKWVLDYLFTPDVPAWFVFSLLGELERGHWGYIKNGSKSFVDAIEKKYKSLGGDIRFHSPVTKILVKDGKACGVKLKDGKEQLADYVISAGDGYTTLYKLLEGKYVTEQLEHRYKTWPVCKPFMFVSFGLNRDLSKETPYNTIALDQPLKYGNGMQTNAIFLRITNFSKVFAPPGKSVLQVEFESEWEYWDKLRNSNRQEYMKQKQELASAALVKLEKHYPGITQQVEMTDVATPATTQRFTMNKNGSWGGFEMTAGGLRDDRERVLPGLRNFYMAGQWALSGGVTPCLFSGKHAVDLIKSGR